MAKSYFNSAVISSFICFLTLAYFFYTSDLFLHWFVIPITLGGILIGIDAIDWVRGRLNLYDPVGILGLLGYHIFFFAPLLHVSWDIWIPSVNPPLDWRPWLGEMAILNFLSLLIYRVARDLPWTSPNLDQHSAAKQSIWRLSQRRFIPILCFALAGSAVLQLMVYKMFGGFMGYIEASSMENREASFNGMGWIFMLSESFPILAMMGFTVYAQKRKNLQTWKVLAIVLFIFLILQLLFGGLRGSRSNTIWALFWAAGIIHFWIRPIPRKIISVGLCFLVVFMYLYGFYKSAGLDAFSRLGDQSALVDLEEETGRSWRRLILQDLGRSDIQAFVLYQMVKPDTDYQLAWGRTYLGTAAVLIPGSLWPDRPPLAYKEGTDVMYGAGSYIPQDFVSSYVYGLSGETMLNFGAWTAPLAYVPFAWIVWLVRHWLLTWHSEDSRKVLLPMLVNLCFVILISNSVDILFFLIKGGFVPFMVLWLSSNRQSITVPIWHQSDIQRKVLPSSKI